MFRHVIWDFDGTLFDTYPSMTKAMQLALQKHGHDVEWDEIYSQLKVTVGHAKKYFRDKFGLGEDFEEDYNSIRVQIEGDMCIPYDGIPELLADIIKAGGKNYICTHRGKTLQGILECRHMEHLFEYSVTSEHGFKLKPDPESVNYLIDKYDMLRSEAVMVGDRELDVLAGQNAGITGCAYSDGSGKPIPCADITAASVAELRKLLLGE